MRGGGVEESAKGRERRREEDDKDGVADRDDADIFTTAIGA